MNQKTNFKQIGFVFSTLLIVSAYGGSSSYSSNTDGNDTSNKGDTITHHGTTYGTVTSPYTSRTWLDRNLGADRVCESYNDTACYGDYYQWGRNVDGHQDSSSPSTNIQATDVNNSGSEYIISLSFSHDWVSSDTDRSGAMRSANWSVTDGSSVCPVDFRVPTILELKAEFTHSGSAKIKNMNDAFKSFLKLPAAGGRHSDSPNLNGQGEWGYLWSSTPNGGNQFGSQGQGFFMNGVWDGNSYRAGGMPIRCVKAAASPTYN